MGLNNIIIARHDYVQLRELIRDSRKARTEDESTLRMLEKELNRASIVDSGQVPGNVVTMNSTVRVLIRGLARVRGKKARQTWTVVFPEEADVNENRISILAPLGTALLGNRVGATFEWDVPAGRRQYKIIRVLHQPEASEKLQQS